MSIFSNPSVELAAFSSRVFANGSAGSAPIRAAAHFPDRAAGELGGPGSAAYPRGWNQTKKLLNRSPVIHLN